MCVWHVSVTDPFAVLYLVDKAKNQMVKVATTEILRDNLNPRWTAHVVVDYMFEVVQEMLVKVFHYKANVPVEQEDRHETIGEARFEVGRLMRSSGQVLNLQLQGAHARDGSVEVRAESQVGTRDLLCVTFSGNKLANKDGFFGTSDPFIIMSRLNEDGTYTTVWYGNKIDNTLNPRWGEAKIPMSRLCNNDYDRPIQIEIMDWDKNGKHQSMGIVKTSVRSILSSNNAPFDVIEPSVQAKKKNYVNSGTLVAGNARIEPHPTFAQVLSMLHCFCVFASRFSGSPFFHYCSSFNFTAFVARCSHVSSSSPSLLLFLSTQFVAGGCEVSLVVAIDFTGSNGDPNQTNSLHYIDHSGRFLNQYEDAITCIGRVLETYDTDKKFPVYGFGARVKQPDGQFSPVQHCISLGGVEVQGIQGVLGAYKGCLPNLMLSGPTLLAPIVNTVTNIVRAQGCRQDNQKYTVLLVLTDGTINDMDETISAIIEASKEAMSIIIIGVGSADFTDMNALDSDKGLLKRGIKTAERDIVQFVAFKDNIAKGVPVVAQQLLAEVPTQVLQFMEKRGIVPNPPVGK